MSGKSDHDREVHETISGPYVQFNDLIEGAEVLLTAGKSRRHAGVQHAALVLTIGDDTFSTEIPRQDLLQALRVLEALL